MAAVLIGWGLLGFVGFWIIGRPVPPMTAGDDEYSDSMGVVAQIGWKVHLVILALGIIAFLIN